MRTFHSAITSPAIAAIMICCAHSTTYAQNEDAISNEVKRINGHWRVVEMVENGNSIPENQMREWLPGGGVMEIVDYTIIFKSPVDGTKSTKTYRVDPTAYPKRIAIMERDNTTGTGIYEFDQGKLVICVTNVRAELPTDFSAPKGSERTLLILSRFEPGTSEIPGLNAKLPKREPVKIPSPPPRQPAPAPAPAPAPTPAPVVAAPQVVAASPPIVADTAAARILTDSEVRNMALGTWRFNDSEGSVDIMFKENGVFQTYRYFKTLRNFQIVFVPTPSSSGNWSVVNGKLMANVTSSSRVDKLNLAFAPSVRSISATDMILVDQLGRVSRAVKLRY